MFPVGAPEVLSYWVSADLQSAAFPKIFRKPYPVGVPADLQSAVKQVVISLPPQGFGGFAIRRIAFPYFLTLNL